LDNATIWSFGPNDLTHREVGGSFRVRRFAPRAERGLFADLRRIGHELWLRPGVKSMRCEAWTRNTA
jgi:hypothetical protein